MEHEPKPEPPKIPETVELPAATPWPIVLASGLTLILAGLLTGAAVSVVGAVLSIIAGVGWFVQVLPDEVRERVPVEAEVSPLVARKEEVARVQIDREIRRTRIPVEVYPYTAGIKGGLAGAVAMALLAILYGILAHHSIWYPINLLAAIVYAQALTLPMSDLTAFHAPLLIVAALMHLAASVLVGLLYGVMLPMFPRRPILLGGLVAPLIWTGLLHSTLGVINPLMNELIDWKWFVASQIGFGVVAGLVVIRQARVRTDQFLPFVVRAGIEAPGLMEEKDRRNDEQ
jgi:hypothetical protein